MKIFYFNETQQGLWAAHYSLSVQFNYIFPTECCIFRSIKRLRLIFDYCLAGLTPLPQLLVPYLMGITYTVNLCSTRLLASINGNGLGGYPAVICSHSLTTCPITTFIWQHLYFCLIFNYIHWSDIMCWKGFIHLVLAWSVCHMFLSAQILQKVFKLIRSSAHLQALCKKLFLSCSQTNF